eukprot:COSAG01_NODE_61192_length_290_cov_3.586387_1_plen_33_part_01
MLLLLEFPNVNPVRAFGPPFQHFSGLFKWLDSA